MKLFTVLFILISSVNLAAIDFNKAAQEIEKDLTEANSKLDDARKKIFSEREELAGQLVVQKSAMEKSKKSSSQLKMEIEELLAEISELDKKIIVNNNSQIDLLEKSIQIRRETETLIPSAKLNLFKTGLMEQDKALENKNILSFFQSFEKIQNQLIEDGFKYTVNEVQAVGKNGEIKAGKLISLSHSHQFLLIDGMGGMAETSKHHSYPELKPVSGIQNGLESIINTGKGKLIFDFSNGLAFKKQAQTKTLSERFESGGVIMYPLLFLALICLLAGVWKTTQLYLVRSRYDDKVMNLLTLIHAGKIDEAQQYVNSLRNPVKKLLHEALNYRDTTRENLEELLNENILAQIPKLDRFMPVLSVSAGAAPLLGLLGTVMGIIKTFEMISLYGTGDPNTMAGGISEALVTTQAGLIVAIPALIWHAVLNRRLKTIIGNLEKAMLSFINGLSLGKTNL